MMSWFFDLFSFFATGGGILATMVLVAAAIVVWDWRAVLPALLLVQISFATLALRVYAVPLAWSTAHVSTMLIACLMLGLSMLQVPFSRSLHQAGNWFLRFLAIGAVLTCWRLVEITISLPQFSAGQISYFTFMAVFAFIILSLSDSPIFTVAGLLLWVVVVQTMLEVLLPYPGVIAIMGAVQLLLALTGSYLILADRVPQRFARRVATDVTFPDDLSMVTVDEVDDTVETAPLPIIAPHLLTYTPPANGEEASERTPQSSG